MASFTLSESQCKRLLEISSFGAGDQELKKGLEGAITPPPPPPVNTLKLKLSADKTGIEVASAPEGTSSLHVAYMKDLNGTGVQYTSLSYPLTKAYVPPSGSPVVDAQAFTNKGAAIGGWAGRVQTTPIVKKEEPPVEKEPPVEPPKGSLVVAVDTSGWGGGLHDELTAGGIKNRRINNPALVGEIEAKGGHVSTVCFKNAGWGDSQGPLRYDPKTYGAEIAQAAKEHKNVDAWEVMNEPEGTQNPTESAKIHRYVELLKATREGFTREGIKAKIIASWAPTYNFGKSWAAAGGLQYVDGVVVHAYGGGSGNHKGLLGARELIEQAHNESGKPVYITEVGWPTALGRPSTGDSQQWSEAQQADAIRKFAAWCREPAQSYVAMFVYFNAVDYGTNNWYGIERSDRSHKPSFAALAEVAK